MEYNKSNLYMFIIWEKSRHKSESVLEDIKKRFIIRDMIEIEWSSKKFANNMQRFYGYNLPNVIKKTKMCGKGPFLLIIVSDPATKLGERRTSYGMELVNTNIYDNKMEYRKWIGGEFPIHGANSIKESNHDLTLLLGKNVKDLENELPEEWDGSVKKLKTEVIGFNGWQNMNQFLYMLNGTVNYVILRNFEELPEEFSSDIHKDIDILTDNAMLMPYLTNGEKSPINDKISPLVKIGGEIVLFDFRYPGDCYYDEKWSKNILNNRELHKNGFYVPGKEDYFYTLLYHAVFHKKKITDDYKLKLENLAKDLEIKEITNKELDNLPKLEVFLEKYMDKMGYRHTYSAQYKIRHNEFLRLVKVSSFLIKTQGVNAFFNEIKGKIKRTILHKTQKTR